MEFIVWGERNEKDVQSGTGFYPGRLSYRLEQGSKVNVCADGFQVNSEPSYSKTFEVIHRGETQMKICHICHGNGYLRRKGFEPAVDPSATEVDGMLQNASPNIKQCYRCKSTGEVSNEIGTG